MFVTRKEVKNEKESNAKLFLTKKECIVNTINFNTDNGQGILRVHHLARVLKARHNQS